MSKVLRLAPWMVAIWAALPAVPAGAQGNIDAGKSPAQIFGDTCSACHRSARELRRASTGFLRTHYTTGSEEAAAMANYLSGVGSDPRSAPQPKQQRPPADTAPATAAKQPPRQQPADQQPKEQPKAAAQTQPKGRPAATAQARPAPVVEERPPDPPPAPPTPPAPVLEPFEE